MAKKTTPTSLSGKRLVEVLRVSRVNGRSGSSFMSPDEQREATRRFCSRENAVIVGTVDETDSVSGGSVEREGLERAIELCDQGEADGIVVAKLDRFARTVLGGLKVIADMQDKGHLLVSEREGVVVGDAVSTATDTLKVTLWLMLAEWQRNTLKESWEATRERHIANGVANVIPYGYLRDDSRGLVPHPDEADFVRQMFQMRADGVGWTAIAKAMNAAGAKPRRAERFTHARISGIVGNRAYLGELKSGEYINEKAHEPLVSVTLFKAANDSRTPRNEAEQQSSMLAGIVRCASCGQKMRSERRGHLRYYRCRREFGFGACPEPVSVPADALDAFVETSFLQDAEEVLMNGLADDGALEAAQKRYDDARVRVRAYVTQGDPTEEGYRDGKDRWDRELRLAQEALTKAQTAARGYELPPAAIEMWDTLDDETKRSFLTDAYEYVAVRPGVGWRADIASRARLWRRDEAGTPDVPLALTSIVWKPAGARETAA